MASVVLRMGGHILAVEGTDEVVFFSSNAAFHPFVVYDARPEFMVRYSVAVNIPPRLATPLYSFTFEEISAECRLYEDAGFFYFSMNEGNGTTLVSMQYRAGSNMVEASTCSNPSALRFSLWFACSMLYANAHTTFVHSSTIVHNGHAVLFLGESGTGKSTHTRLWLENFDKTHLLNDDSPFLSIDDGGCPTVYGAPWSGKTPCYHPLQFPLKAVVRLSQAPHNRIRRLSIPAAIAALQPSLPPALMQSDFFADQLFVIISAVISKTAVYHLECLPDANAAKLSCSTIYKDLP
ncbi:MAG: hypothetical protein J6X58_04220 [Bacteroidales bacterium]|nr:hypothetical protein [Bacteroidales bacterium]